MDNTHRIGTLLRFGYGPAALMMVDQAFAGSDGRGARYAGLQLGGGTAGVSHDECWLASQADCDLWLAQYPQYPALQHIATQASQAMIAAARDASKAAARARSIRAKDVESGMDGVKYTARECLFAG